MDLGKSHDWLPWFQMALGMAEYRSGHFAEADAALIAAATGGKDNPRVVGTSAFYRAMSLFRQGKEKEALQLTIGAASEMKPLPKDEKNPLTDNAGHDDLIVWMAYKEARALIKPEPAPAAPCRPAGNDRVAGTRSAPRLAASWSRPNVQTVNATGRSSPGQLYYRPRRAGLRPGSGARVASPSRIALFFDEFGTRTSLENMPVKAVAA